jgi:SAM-dependent methyltransferase
MLAVAHKRAADEGADIRFLVGDAQTLDFRDRTFDVVVSLRLVMHAPDWRACVAELCRVADRLVILDYPSRRSVARFQSTTRSILHSLGVRTEPYRVLSHRDVVEALDRSGFRVRSVHRQFVLPIAFHKLMRSRRLTVAIEGLLDRAGLLKIFGSPVTLVAERCVIS